jgi:hypothetical protein
MANLRDSTLGCPLAPFGSDWIVGEPIPDASDVLVERFAKFDERLPELHRVLFCDGMFAELANLVFHSTIHGAQGRDREGALVENIAAAACVRYSTYCR